MSIYEQDLNALAEAVNRLLDAPKKRRRHHPLNPTLVGGGGGIPDVVLAASDTHITTDADLLSTSFGSDDLMLLAAFERMSAKNQAWIHLLEGTYTFSSEVVIPAAFTRVKLTGAGMNTTTIKAADTATMDSLIDHSSVTSSGSFTLEDLTFNGNASGGANASTINTGLVICGNGTFGWRFWSRVRFTDSSSSGVNFSSSGGHLILDGCRFDNNTSHGLVAGTIYVSAVGCRFNSNGDNGVFHIGGGFHHLYVGCEFNGNGGAGVQSGGLSGSAGPCIVMGCSIKSNGGDGIDNDGSAADPCIIIGNRIWDNTGAAASVKAGSVVLGNLSSGNGTNLGGQTMSASGGGGADISTVAATGSAETLNLANGNVHDVTMDTDVTFTFTGSTSGKASEFTLILRQDGTGGHTPTWPTSVDWPAGTAPTVSSAADAVDVFRFLTVDDGTTWLGWTIGQAFA